MRKVIAKRPKMMGPEMWRQEVRFKYDELPVAKDWKIGENYKLILDVEQVSMDKDRATFAIVKVGNYSEKGEKYGKSSKKA